MTATITATNGAGTVTALSVLSPYTADARARNVVHALIGGGIAVALVAADPRRGTFQALFSSEADAWTCQALHRAASTLTLTDTDRPAVGMTYVLNGACSVALDPDSLSVWVVSVDFQEVT